MRACYGMTLVELVVVVVVASILITTGIPALQTLIDENRVVSQANGFLRAINMARAEAVRRGERVTLCPSENGETCALDQGYDQGWILFTGPEAGRSLADGGRVLRVFSGSGSGVRIQGNGSMARYISYRPNGRTRQLSGAFQAGTIQICSRSQRGRAIIISRAGRARVTAGDCAD